MRGIPLRAVEFGTPIRGTDAHAGDIADPTNVCQWNPDMLGVDHTHPAAAYYDSTPALYAGWGVDFIKADDMLWPYQAADIESNRRAGGGARPERFVDGVADSLSEAAAHLCARPWFRAVYAGDTPVGFLMLADGAEPGNEVIPWPYYLWRMLIGGRHQGRGYGRATLGLVVAHLHERSDADTLVTGIVPKDGSPYGFYLRCGFRPTGDFFTRQFSLCASHARDRPWGLLSPVDHGSARHFPYLARLLLVDFGSDPGTHESCLSAGSAAH